MSAKLRPIDAEFNAKCKISAKCIAHICKINAEYNEKLRSMLNSTQTLVGSTLRNAKIC